MCIRDRLDKAEIKGMAHITGGGLLENVPRVLPDNCQVHIDSKAWPALPIFQLIQEKGNVEKREMFRTLSLIHICGRMVWRLLMSASRSR